MKRKKQTVDKTDFIVQKIRWTASAIIVTFKGAAWQQPDPGNWGHLYRWSEISGGSMD